MKTFASHLLLLLLPVLAACTNIDCPVENVVLMRCGLYASETGERLTLGDTLSVCAAMKDTVLVNRAILTNELQIPLAQRSGVDTLLFRLASVDGKQATDTLFIEHDAYAHFEKVDCPAAVFHTLRAVSHTSHPLALLPLTVDSVRIVRQNVTYSESENVRIYLRATVSE